MMNCHRIHRRSFLRTAAAGFAVATGAARPRATGAQQTALPTSPVAIGRCRRYDFELVKATLSNLFDMLGGIPTLVRNKTVTIKLNLTGNNGDSPVFSLSRNLTMYTHPAVALAASSLFQDYGATRINICESNYLTGDARGTFARSGIDVDTFDSTVPIVQWENTRNRGSRGSYVTMPAGEGAFLYESFDLNRAYYDTDVMVSIPKIKNHDIAGITVGMKNLFGITPQSLYGSDAAFRHEDATSARSDVLHTGNRPPEAPGLITPVPSNDDGFRVPRVVVDICSARPIDLTVVDAIVAESGGEGEWNGQQLDLMVPNLLIVGRNPVCTDAVSTAVMGFDPEADDWTKPFYNGANTFRLAAERGLGTNRLSEIDVAGLSVKEARYAFQPGAHKE